MVNLFYALYVLLRLILEFTLVYPSFQIYNVHKNIFTIWKNKRITQLFYVWCVIYNVRVSFNAKN